MRDPIENISKLQKQLNDLQLENQILKNILDRAGVSYKQSIARLKAADEGENYDPEQGKELYILMKLRTRWQIIFSRDFGDVRMFMLREMKRKILEKPGTLRNAGISGQVRAIGS